MLEVPITGYPEFELAGYPILGDFRPDNIW